MQAIRKRLAERPRRPTLMGLATLLLLFASSTGPTAASADELPSGIPDFRTEVMAVISKAGCNMGACHGNLNGKGGFFLSLRGQDPQFDYRALTREFSSRRTNPFDAAQSLVLLKPAGRIAHQGGVRFREDSIEYQILHDWIAAGSPASPVDSPTVERLVVEPSDRILLEPEQSVSLHVVAHLSDGSQRDVTSLACYEASDLNVSISSDGLVQRLAFGETTVLVRYLNQQVPVRLAFVPAGDFTWNEPPANNEIDTLVFDKLRSLRINPSELSDDSTFVRRAYLDTVGILPTSQEARRFVADGSPHKRAALIDHLLARPEFADHWALKWSDVLRNEERVLDPTGVDRFHAWIRDGIADGKPVDQFVRELVASSGSTYENPAANYYRANRDAVTRGETTARLFLGVRLQCARCHNHPFDRWTQEDYYSWAALFARVDYEIIENKRGDKFDKNEFVGEQIVQIKDEGELKNPTSGKNATPKWLGAETPTLDKKADRLAPLAQWLTSADNRLFVASQVNFIWYHLMGRGLVDPIDDFRDTNPAVNPPLLDYLSREFIAGGFDLRHLVRVIMNARVYQLDAEPNRTNGEDEINFSRALVRRLPAEKLLDAQSQVIGAWPEFGGYPVGTRAGQLAGVRRGKDRRSPRTDGDRFLAAFGKPERLLACDCERSNETTLSHAFLFISGTALNDRLTRSGNRLVELARSDLDDASVVDELFWSALSRPPSEDEQSAALAAIASAEDRLNAVQDLAWALLNAKEFVFRR